MDHDLKRYLDQKFADMDTKFATKQDLERVEKALLTEFHTHASSAELRKRTRAAVLRAIDLDLEALN